MFLSCLYIDPYFKAKVDGFSEWIKIPQGLATYLSNFLQQNDPYSISKLVELYNEFYRLFYG
jgi:hypothetical protein